MQEKYGNLDGRHSKVDSPGAAVIEVSMRTPLMIASNSNEGKKVFVNLMEEMRGELHARRGL